MNLWHYLWANRDETMPIAFFLVSAFIMTMPEPGAKVSWLTLYTWAYDFLHQAINIKRPTQPGAPGQNQKGT